MGTTNSNRQSQLHQWQTDEVGRAFMRLVSEERNNLISSILSSKIEQSNLGDVNYKLGQLYVLDYVQSTLFTDDLLDSMREEHG